MAILGKFRRDTLANWQANDPILADGEFALVASDSNHPKKYDYWVCGDGTTVFTSLTMASLASSVGITGITDVIGNSSSLAASQKLVTEKFTEVEAEVTDISDKMPLPADITGTISTQSSDPGYGLYIKSNGTVASYSTYMISNPITLYKGDRFLSSSRAGGTQIFAKYLGDYSTFDPISGYYVNSNTTYQIDWIADEDCQVVVCGERASLGDYTIKPGGYDYCASKGATILGWILTESFSVSNATYTDGVVNSPVSVTWPDGVTGTLTLVRDSDGNVSSLTATHGTDTYVLSVTRDANGNVTKTEIN